MFDLVDKLHKIHMVLIDHIQYDIDYHLIVSKRFELIFDQFHQLQHFLVHLDFLLIQIKIFGKENFSFNLIYQYKMNQLLKNLIEKIHHYINTSMNLSLLYNYSMDIVHNDDHY